MLKILTHSFMAPKSMSSEVENIEIKSKEKNNTDRLNLSVLFFSLTYSSYLFIHLLIIIRIVYALHKDLTVFNLIS